MTRGYESSVKDLAGFHLAATDGSIGEVQDCYFDDVHWTVRYLVVDMGGWLSGRKVLISPLTAPSRASTRSRYSSTTDSRHTGMARILGAP
jgi:hypothetical protein